MNAITQKRVWLPAFLAAIVLAAGLGAGAVLIAQDVQMNHQSEHGSTEYYQEVAAETEAGTTALIAAGKYKCCLAKPCSECFSDPEHQDRDLVCDCLVDIMNSKHPCGECIGEILEGHGNPLIAEYFATAIAEKVGEQHLPTLKKIVAEQYSLPADA
jgi:hypothetical protein